MRSLVFQSHQPCFTSSGALCNGSLPTRSYVEGHVCHCRRSAVWARSNLTAPLLSSSAGCLALWASILIAPTTLSCGGLRSVNSGKFLSLLFGTASPISHGHYHLHGSLLLATDVGQLFCISLFFLVMGVLAPLPRILFDLPESTCAAHHSIEIPLKSYKSLL